MRILALTSEYPPAKGYGLARYASELAAALAQAGHVVHVVTCNYSSGRLSRQRHGVTVHDRREVWPLTHYHWVGDAVLNNVYLVERGMEAADEVGPFDVILSHDWLAAHAAKSLASILRIPWVLFMHDSEVGKRGNKLDRSQLYIAEMEGWAMKHASRVICCSEFMRHELQDKYDCPSERIEVIPCGVNPDSFQAEADFVEYRRLLAPDDHRLVLFVGRLSHMKGPDLLLEAVPAVLVKRSNVRFVFCGDGHLIGPLQKRAAELGLQESVAFLGHLSGKVLAATYRVADALVVPSRYEPFGMVALEGAVCGLPVITSGVGGLRETAERETAVGTMPENTSAAIARALLQILDGERRVLPHTITEPSIAHRWSSVAGRVAGVLENTIGVRH